MIWRHIWYHMFLLQFTLLFCKKRFCSFYSLQDMKLEHQSQKFLTSQLDICCKSFAQQKHLFEQSNDTFVKQLHHRFNVKIIALCQKKFSCNLMLPFMHSDIFLGYVHLQTNFRPYVEMLCTPNDVADAPSKV